MLWITGFQNKVVEKLGKARYFGLAYSNVSSAWHRDLSRDSGWEPLRSTGCKLVRQIALDETWSGLRFRALPAMG